jgi:hypothetical protein
MLCMKNYVHVFAPVANIVSIAQLCNDEWEMVGWL